MMCTTELHGGVCHRTSTPHKSGNKMKEKKKRLVGKRKEKTLWSVRASNNCVSLARTGPTATNSRRDSGPVLIVEACVIRTQYVLSEHDMSYQNTKYVISEHNMFYQNTRCFIRTQYILTHSVCAGK